MTFYVQTYPYRRMARRWAENREQSLRVNVREEDEAYVLSALVPGIHSDDLNIQVLEDVVRIEGEYKRSGPVDRADEANYLVREFPNGGRLVADDRWAVIALLMGNGGGRLQVSMDLSVVADDGHRRTVWRAQLRGPRVSPGGYSRVRVVRDGDPLMGLVGRLKR